LIRWRRPSGREIEELLGSGDRAFSYVEVGQTAQLDAPGVRDALASRYDVDHHRFDLGTGRGRFERARSALRAWRQFEVPWLELHGAQPVAKDQVVATLTRVAGLWYLNPCRVVYSGFADDADSAAFAYGTLGGHVESGEERFSVSFDAATGRVSYEIRAFSRPAVLLTKLGYPFARRIQRRFAAASARALARAVD
jgi:uncharacterized protein (UPF0548 family)